MADNFDEHENDPYREIMFAVSNLPKEIFDVLYEELDPRVVIEANAIIRSTPLLALENEFISLEKDFSASSKPNLESIRKELLLSLDAIDQNPATMVNEELAHAFSSDQDSLGADFQAALLNPKNSQCYSRDRITYSAGCFTGFVAKYLPDTLWERSEPLEGLADDAGSAIHSPFDPHERTPRLLLYMDCKDMAEGFPVIANILRNADKDNLAAIAVCLGEKGQAIAESIVSEVRNEIAASQNLLPDIMKRIVPK